MATMPSYLLKLLAEKTYIYIVDVLQYFHPDFRDCSLIVRFYLRYKNLINFAMSPQQGGMLYNNYIPAVSQMLSN